jgi:competence protein ComEC
MKRWPLQEAWFWERAPFFRLLLPVILGIMLYSYIRPAYHSVILISAIVSFIGFAVVSSIKSQSNVLRWFRFASLHVTLMAAAWLLSYFNDVQNDSQWYAHRKSEAYIARITTPPIEKEKTWKLAVDIIGTIDGKATRGRAFVYVYKNKLPLLFAQGDTIILPNNLQAIATTGNPFAFDYAAYCNRNNIYHQQFLSTDDIVLYNKAKPSDIGWVQRLHNQTVSIIDRYIKDRKVAGLMQAMLIGEEANLDADTRNAYAAIGIIHIIAISGSHITFFFIAIAFLLGWIKHKKWKWVKYIAAIPLIWLYVAMSGAPPSAVRAALMFSILGIGFAFGKQSYSLNHLFATAFILLCAEPMWLYAIGFQLSFIAVLSLIIFYRPIYKWYIPANRIARLLWQVVAASIAAEILVAPLVVYYFHLFPLLFIVANIAAYLFMGIALVGGMLLVVFSTVPAVAGVIGLCIEYIVSLFNRLVYTMQTVNPASFSYLYIDATELFLLFLIVTGLSVYFFKQKKGWLYAGLIAAVLLMASFNIKEWQALHQQKLVVYNINKANHVELIQGKQHQIICTDTTIDEQKKNYVLKPAHTGFRAWHKGKPINEVIFCIGNNTALVLNQKPITNNSFPVDYVIINYQATLKTCHLSIGHFRQSK